MREAKEGGKDVPLVLDYKGVQAEAQTGAGGHLLGGARPFLQGETSGHIYEIPKARAAALEVSKPSLKS